MVDNDDMHPATFIKEEMDARGWTPGHLAVAMAQAMGTDAATEKFKVDIYFAVAPDPRLRLGATGVAIARAFGVSDKLFLNLEAAWLRGRGISEPPTDNEIDQ